MRTSLDITAQAAATLLASGDAESMAEAIARASAEGDAPPARSLVRRHLESLRQASLGMTGWRRLRLARLEALLEFADTVAFVMPEATCVISGRAAEGHVDETSPARMRVIGVAAPPLFDALEVHDLFGDHIGTVTTALGSVAAARFSDADLLVEIMILPEAPEAYTPRNLIDARPVATGTRDAFRTFVEGARRVVEGDD